MSTQLRVQHALDSLVGKTILTATVSSQDDGLHGLSELITIETEDATVELETRDGRHRESWLEVPK